MRMPTKTRKAMENYALTIPPCSARAQCYTIANYELNDETIAQRIQRDHSDSDSHLRAASLMVEAGCATEKQGKKHCYGVFTFEDGSEFE